MANLYDYFKWRGDLKLNQDGFNDIDNLIFSVICYCDLEGIVTGIGDSGHIKMKDAYKKYEKTKDVDHLQSLTFQKETPIVFSVAASSDRFKNIKLSNHVNQIDTENVKQFSATLFTIDKDLHYIAFRGTDTTLIGWKEDFEMSFKDYVPSQLSAVNYAEKVIRDNKGQFIFGGHSKGGNLAMFAALNISESLKERIAAVYNNDGPGFKNNILVTDSFKEMKDKIITLIPETAIVGRLMEAGNNYRVLSSKGKTMYQHNPLLWELEGRDFIYKEKLSNESVNIDQTLKSWLEQLSYDDRKTFIDNFYNMLMETGFENTGEMNKDKLALADKMLKSYKIMSSEEKKQMKRIVDLLLSEYTNTFKASLSKEIDSLINRAKETIQIKSKKK